MSFIKSKSTSDTVKMLTKYNKPNTNKHIPNVILLIVLLAPTASHASIAAGQQHAKQPQAPIGSQTNDLFGQSQQSTRALINGNHATYVEPPADFKPIIYEPERQVSSSGADLESLESPNQLLSLAQTQHSVSVQSPSQNPATAFQLQSQQQQQQQQQQHKSGPRDGGDKLEFAANNEDEATVNEGGQQQPALKPSIGRWSDWTDMSLEPDLASSDTQLSAIAAVASEQPARRLATPSVPMHHPNMFLFNQAAAPLPMPIITPHRALNLYARHPFSNAYQRHHQQQAAIKYAQAARANEALERRMAAIKQQQQAAKYPTFNSAASALDGAGLINTSEELRQPRLVFVASVPQQQQFYSYQPLFPGFPRQESPALNQLSLRAPPSLRSSSVEQFRMSKLHQRSKLVNTEARPQQRRQVTRAAPLVMSHQALRAAASSAAANATPAQTDQRAYAQQQQHARRLPAPAHRILRTAPAQLVPSGPNQQLAPNSTASSPVRRGPLRSVQPVGLTSWFLGGIRDLNGRHWHLPHEVVSKMSVDDIDLKHDEQPQEVGTNLQPGDTTSATTTGGQASNKAAPGSSQKEVQGPPMVHAPARPTPSKSQIPRR